MEQNKKKESSLKVGYKSKSLIRSDLGEVLGKVPPQAIDLEEAVLGALMLEKDALSNVIEILKPGSFYKEAHLHIYEAIVELFNNAEPIDLLTVTSQLRKNGKLEIVGGPYYITELTSRVNSAANIEYHARIIAEQSIKRELISISGDIQKLAYEDTTDVFDLLDKTESALFEVSESHIRKNYAGLRTIMKEAMDELEEIAFLGPWDANIEKGIYSYQAPMSVSLMGSKVGDMVEIQGDDGMREMEILEITLAEVPS